MNKKSLYNNKHTEKILSVNISTLTKHEILKIIERRTKEKKRTIVFTPNTQMLLSAQKSKNELKLLNSADINIPDGIGVVMASRLTNGKIKTRIGGIDLAEDILKMSQKMKYRIFLLGAERGIAKKAKEKLEKRYPRINICGTYHGYFNKKDNEKIIKQINQSKADIIFVCMGSPAQEKWIASNHTKLSKTMVFIGLGGSLDVWAGKTHRAPLPIQAVGLEWLYRTIKEPKRARIFLDIPKFLFTVLKNQRKAPSK